jgi:hypothetical protein
MKNLIRLLVAGSGFFYKKPALSYKECFVVRQNPGDLRPLFRFNGSAAACDKIVYDFIRGTQII